MFYTPILLIIVGVFLTKLTHSNIPFLIFIFLSIILGGMALKEFSRIDLYRGPITDKYTESRVNMDALTGFGIYSPLQDRIKLVMNNIASNREIFGIDPSVAKAGENIDVARK